MNAPKVSMLVLTFNQRDLVTQAVSSCFAQEGAPVEILLSDDASTDGTFEVLEGLAAQYRGPHRVRVRRNAQRLGVAGHYNEAIRASTGELLLTAAGDDASVPHRARVTLEAWQRSGETLDLLACPLIDMDGAGALHGALEVDQLSRWSGAGAWLRRRPRVIGAGHAFTRRLHQRFGDFHPELPFEDQAMTFRACALGGGLTLDEPLVHYRRGGSSRGAPPSTGQAYLARAATRHQHQRALYRQVAADLARLDLAPLFRGRPKRRLAQSELALALLATDDVLARLRLTARADGAGWLERWRLFISLSFPSVSGAFKRARS